MLRDVFMYMNIYYTHTLVYSYYVIPPRDRIWTRDPSIGGRKTILHSIFDVRNPSDPHPLHSSGRYIHVYYSLHTHIYKSALHITPTLAVSYQWSAG